MPTVLRVGPYRFAFYSNERNEPPHVHVSAGGNEAKVWLADHSVSRNSGFADHELREIVALVYENRDLIAKRWTDYFGHS